MRKFWKPREEAVRMKTGLYGENGTQKEVPNSDRSSYTLFHEGEFTHRLCRLKHGI